MSIPSRHKTLLSFLSLVIILIAGCTLNTSTKNPGTIAPTITKTISESSQPPSPTLPLPTPSATPLPPTETATPTKTPITPTLTPTSIPPSLVVNKNAVCFIGPGNAYGVRTYLIQGEATSLLGRTQDNNWWMVKSSESGVTCWVSADLVSVGGDISLALIFTPEPTPKALVSPTPVLKGVPFYLIALNTGGPWGCDDGLVYYYTGVPRTDKITMDIAIALKGLFKLRSKFVGDYYNPLYNAHLAIKHIEFNPATGDVQVYLGGHIPKPADICEMKRVHAVIWETVRKFPNVKTANFWLDNRLLGDLIAVNDR